MSAAKSSRRFHLHHCFSCFICSQEKLKQQVFRWLHLWWRVNISTQRAVPESQALQYYPRQLRHIYIRYHQISDQSFSIFSQQQIPIYPTLNIKPRPPPDLLGSFSDKWLRLKPSAISANQTPLKWTWTMYNWGINTKFFCWSEITWVDTATPGQLPVGTGNHFGKSCSSLVFFRDIRTCSHQKIFQKRCF